MKHAFIVSLALVSLSCNKTIQNSSSLNNESVIKEVKEMFDGYHSDIKATGLIAEFKYLDNSADFFWVPPGYNTTLTYDSVRSILEKNAKAFTNIDFHWDALRIIPLTDSIATYSGIVGGTMIDTAGFASTVRIIESGVVIKRPDGWKLLSGQSAALNTP